MPTSSSTVESEKHSLRWPAVAAFTGAFFGLPAWVLAAEHFLQGRLASPVIVDLQVWPVIVVGVGGLALLAHARLRPVGLGLVAAVSSLCLAYALLLLLIISSDSSGFMS